MTRDRRSYALRMGALHDLYAKTLRRCRDEARRPDRKRDLKWLLDTARERLEELRSEMTDDAREEEAVVQQ
jgi:hypothetical protein